jgi:predicted nucleic acid-binding protein
LSVYADTSFIFSLYVFDANSGSAAAHMEDASLPILISSLGELEFLNAISLRLFRKELGPSEAEAARRMFEEDIHQGIFQLSPLTSLVFGRAALIAQRQTPKLGTRTLDVLHVASALILNASTFYTFDRSQRALAKREGLTVR